MNVIKIDIEKIKQSIDEYIIHNTEWMLQIDTKINYAYPIVFMNEDTLHLLQKESRSLYQTTINLERCPKKLFNCHVAIADWLPFGEVKLM